VLIADPASIAELRACAAAAQLPVARERRFGCGCEVARKMGLAVGVLVLGRVDEDERGCRELNCAKGDEDGGPDCDRVSRDE